MSDMNADLKGKLVIIMPAFNEEGWIRSTIENIRKQIDADMVVVNDGSKDGTSEEARRAGATVLEHPFNLGYGAAIQTGYAYALESGYDFAVQMDADGQHSPLSIEVLLEPVMNGEVDIAIGSRFEEGGYRVPLVRRMGMIFFSAITSVIIRKKITDPTSGYQALNKEIMRFYASDSYPSDYPDADVIIMLHKKGIRFREVPVLMHAAYSGKSMHGGIIRPLFYIFKMMLSIFVTLLRKEEKI
jgi:glycosyltransferase involved in cell wall biosynthesis